MRLIHLIQPLTLACLIFSSAASLANPDLAIISRTGLSQGRIGFNISVLEESLRRTVKKYGPYRLEQYNNNLARPRLLEELRKGDTVNIGIVATQPSWEEQLIPIWIPTDMGLAGFRIGLIHQDSLAKTEAIHTETQLKQLSIGVGISWSSRQVMETEGYRLETAADQEALTKMLISHRLDYFPRGINELFTEFDERTAQYPDLMIDPNLLLILPLPTYIFVSPQAPRLAKRIAEGMESMVRDHTLRKMLLAFNEEALQRAKLCSRHLIRIRNPLLSPKHPLGRKELWFDPYDPRNGLCPAAKSSAASRLKH